MKNVKLVLLGLSVATIGVVSCEMEDSVTTGQIQEKTNSLRIDNQKQFNPVQEYSHKETQTDTLSVYKTEDHGTKGDGKLGDD